jgi:hypothetical protein
MITRILYKIYKSQIYSSLSRVGFHSMKRINGIKYVFPLSIVTKWKVSYSDTLYIIRNPSDEKEHVCIKYNKNRRENLLTRERKALSEWCNKNRERFLNKKFMLHRIYIKSKNNECYISDVILDPISKEELKKTGFWKLYFNLQLKGTYSNFHSNVSNFIISKLHKEGS